MSNNKSSNPCARTVPKEKAYEVWECPGTGWTWRVLKKYQSPVNEAGNSYARWFCFVTSPMCPDGEMGDVYVREIQSCAVRIK